MTTDFSPAETLDIHSLETLKVMADPLRMQIVDVLRQGTATVKEIAARLRVSPKSLYYHVNLLDRNGLIRVVDTRLVSGIVEKHYRATAYLFNFREPAMASGTLPLQGKLDAVFSMFAITQDEIRVALESEMADLDEEAEPTRRLYIAWDLIDLEPDQLGDIVNRMQAVLDGYRSEGAELREGQPYRLFVSLFPTYRRGERPASAVSNHPQEGLA